MSQQVRSVCVRGSTQTRTRAHALRPSPAGRETGGPSDPEYKDSVMSLEGERAQTRTHANARAHAGRCLTSHNILNTLALDTRVLFWWSESLMNYFEVAPAPSAGL